MDRLLINSLLMKLVQPIGSKSLPNHHLEDILGKPIVRHRKIPLLASIWTPRVLDPPSNWLARGVEMNGNQSHSMIHGTFSRIDPLSFGHVEVETKGRFVVKEIGIEDA